MSFWKRLVSYENVQEIKPGLFVSKQKHGYQVVYPYWINGKFSWYNFLLRPGLFQSAFKVALILFLWWAYKHDTSACRQLIENFTSNPQSFCSNYILNPGHIPGLSGSMPTIIPNG